MTATAFSHADARLRLREFQPADAADVLALHADPRVRALLPDEQPLHEPRWAANFVACLAAFYRRHEGLGIWRCAVPLPGGGEQFAGWFSLMPLQPAADAAAVGVHPGDAELGSRLLPVHWGNGLSLLGGEVLLRHAFAQQRVRAVWGICHPDNRAARACLDALGFVPRGRARYEGQASDHHVLEAADWPALQPLSHRERLRRHRRAAASPTPVSA